MAILTICNQYGTDFSLKERDIFSTKLFLGSQAGGCKQGAGDSKESMSHN